MSRHPTAQQKDSDAPQDMNSHELKITSSRFSSQPSAVHIEMHRQTGEYKKYAESTIGMHFSPAYREIDIDVESIPELPSAANVCGRGPLRTIWRDVVA